MLSSRGQRGLEAKFNGLVLGLVHLGLVASTVQGTKIVRSVITPDSNIKAFLFTYLFIAQHKYS